MLVTLVCVLALLNADAQITVTDGLGRTVTLSGPARRIITLAPSITESLFAIGAGDQVVGVTDYCTYPAAARLKTHVGGMTNPSIETIVALRPDLLLVSMEGNMLEDYRRLLDLGTPLVVTNPRTLEGIFASLELLGTLTGQTDSAGRVVKVLRSRVGRLPTPDSLARTTTLLFISLQPLIAVGARTYLNELLERAGGRNLAAAIGLTYPVISREAVIAYDPDVLLILSDVLDSAGAVTSLYPEWSQLTAVRRGHVYRVDADALSRPGPRAVDGLYLLHSFFRRTSP